MIVKKFNLFKESKNNISDQIEDIFLSAFEELFPYEQKYAIQLGIDKYLEMNRYEISKWPNINTYQIIVDSYKGIPIREFLEKIPGFEKRIKNIGGKIIIQYTDSGNSMFSSKVPKKTLHKASIIIYNQNSEVNENISMDSLIENAFLQSYSGMLYGIDGNDITNNYNITQYSDGYMINIYSRDGLDINEFNQNMKSLVKKLDNLGFYMTSEHFNVKNESKSFQTQIIIKREP